MILKNYIQHALGIGVLALIAILFAVIFASQIVKADGSTINTFFSISSSSPEAVGTASTVVVATSTGRTFLKVANLSQVPMYCNYGKSAVGNQGFLINASSTFTMNGFDEPVYTGSLNCIASSSAQVYAMTNY